MPPSAAMLSMQYVIAALVVLLVGACMNPAPPARSGDTGAVLVRQEQANWCWLAVTEMTGRALTGLDVPQCEMAGEGCCDPARAATAECDHQGLVWESLATFYGLTAAPVPFNADALRAELRAGRPVVVDYFRSSGGGHSVLVTAFDMSKGFKRLDPMLGESWTADAAVYGDGYTAARMVVVSE